MQNFPRSNRTHPLVLSGFPQCTAGIRQFHFARKIIQLVAALHPRVRSDAVPGSQHSLDP